MRVQEKKECVERVFAEEKDTSIRFDVAEPLRFEPTAKDVGRQFWERLRGPSPDCLLAHRSPFGSPGSVPSGKHIASRTPAREFEGEASIKYRMHQVELCVASRRRLEMGVNIVE